MRIRMFKPAVDVEAALANLRRVFEAGQLAEGPQADAFERRLSERFKTTVVVVNSGTTALEMAYRLAGIGEGSVVISTPMTCVATNMPLLHLGAQIVWADVDPHTGLINPEDVAQLLKQRPEATAIVTVDWGGLRCDYPRLRDALAACDSPARIVEDAAHYIEQIYHQKGGSRLAGDFVCWSFQAIKHLTCGDGGAVAIPGDISVNRAKRMRWFGLMRGSGDITHAQEIETAGFKWHMSDVDAAIGLANLTELDKRLAKVHDHAATYYHRVKDHIGDRLLAIPPERGGTNYSAWLYTVLVSDRQAFQKHMARRGIETSVVHTRNDEKACFARFRRSYLRGLDYFSAHQISVPVGPHLSDDDAEVVAFALEDWAEGR